jgi:hypothetical protein
MWYAGMKLKLTFSSFFLLSVFVFSSFLRQQQEQDPTNLYLANLPAHITEQDLHDMLYKYGTVISTRVLRDGGSQSRGVGFARYINFVLERNRARPSRLRGCRKFLFLIFAKG